ncbi:LxmA leader domain family RiPP [Nocardioides pantholopis]|uniref:LxmA leader domain family RiPP n=1 Tax=Nocardioides pantholopis TaxID=2483798 RepID=UPI000F0854E5|nr:LxmA leader domain family RiPP [Nocardioides pantholopis]
MSTKDLIAGYASYTDAAELGAQHEDQAAAVTPTVTSSAHCVASIGASISVSVWQTQEHGC